MNMYACVSHPAATQHLYRSLPLQKYDSKTGKQGNNLQSVNEPTHTHTQTPRA